MNPYLRYSIMPIWIVAGILVSFTAAVIITPFAIYHCIRDRMLEQQEERARAAKTQERNADTPNP